MLFPQCRCAPTLQEPSRREVFISGVLDSTSLTFSCSICCAGAEWQLDAVACAFLQDDGTTSRRERGSCPVWICDQTGSSHNQLTGQAAPPPTPPLTTPCRCHPPTLSPTSQTGTATLRPVAPTSVSYSVSITVSQTSQELTQGWCVCWVGGT